MTTRLAQGSQPDWVGQRCCPAGKETRWCLCVATSLSWARYSSRRQEQHACCSAASNTLPSPEDCCMCGDSTLSCMVICAYFFRLTARGAKSTFCLLLLQEAVSFCAIPQLVFHGTCETTQLTPSVFPRLLIVIHMCTFHQEEETNHMVKGVWRKS